MCKLLLPILLTATTHAAVKLNDQLIPLVHDGGGWSTQVTVVNLSGKPASVIATFMTPTGFNPVWAVSVESTTGKVVGNLIDLPLAAGEAVLTDQIVFDNQAHFFVALRNQWPQLKDFRGTVEWTVSFPTADRYEARILSGVMLLRREGTPWQVLSGMTFPADQPPSSPYQ